MVKVWPLHSIEKIDTNKGEKEFVMTHAGIPPHWSKDDLIRNSNKLGQFTE